MAIIEFDPRTTAELRAMQQTMSTLKSMGATVMSVELNGKKRLEDSSKNNAQILKWLAEGVKNKTGVGDKSGAIVKRDFISMNPSDAKEIGERYVDIASVELQSESNRVSNTVNEYDINAGVGITRQRTRAEIEKRAKEIANEIAGKALIASMEKVKDIIAERIESGVDYMGDKVEELSDDYEEYKENKHGHIYPIGIATGQVIDNLTPGKRNIRLKRK
jgi:hypothetical protein